MKNKHMNLKFTNQLCLFTSQGLLLREKGPEVQSLDEVIKQRNLPENQQEAFKTGFTEGFMRSQALTQRTQGMWFSYSAIRHHIYHLKR